jgi:hypothetical protein
MALATLSVDLVASIARFEADMGRAARVAELAASRMDRAFVGVGAVFTGTVLASAAQEVVRQLVTLVPQLVNAVAGFQDLEEKTGASAVALAAFQTAGDVAGTSVDQLAGFMVKLTGTLSKTNDETKGAGAALKALGLDLEAFKQLAPEDQFLTLAERLNGFQDGASKTAVAIALLGRSGAEALPFFKALGEEGLSQVRLSKEQIAAADELADRNARLRSELRQVAQAAATQALPAFNALVEELIKAATGVNGVGEAAADLQGNTAIRDFAESAVIAVATVGEAVTGLAKLVRALGGSFQAVGADVKFFGSVVSVVRKNGTIGALGFEDGRKELQAALDERNKAVEEANKRYVDLFEKSGTEVSDGLRDRFARDRLATEAGLASIDKVARGQDQGSGGKPKLNFTFNPEADKQAREANQRRQALLQASLAETERALQRERDLFEFQGRFLEGEYEAGVVDLRRFYAERDAIEQQALQAQLDANAEKSASLEAYRRTVAEGSRDAIQAESQIRELEDASARAREQSAQRSQLAAQQQAASFKALASQVAEFAAQVKQLQGDELGAARIRSEQAIESARLLSRQSGTPFDEQAYRTLLENVNLLAEAQRRLGVATQRAGVEEEIFLVRAEQRGATLAEQERGVFEIRSRSLEQLRTLSREADALASSAGPDSPAVQFARELRLQLELAERSVDPALERIRAFSDGVAGSLANAAGEAVLNFNDLRGVLANLEQDLLRIATRALITEPLEANLKSFLGSLTTGSGGIGDFFKGIFGAPSAGLAPGESAGIPDGIAQLGGAAAKDAALTAAITTASTAQTAALSTAITAASTAEVTGLSAVIGSTAAAQTAALVAAIAAGSSSIVLAIAAQRASEAGGDALGAFIAAAGFDAGGYTGNAGVKQPAGVVHGQEFVFSAPAVRQLGVPMLEQLHRAARGGAPRLAIGGFADGGLVPVRQMAAQTPAPRRDAGGPGGETFNFSPTFVLYEPASRQTQDQIAARALEGAQRARRIR